MLQTHKIVNCKFFNRKLYLLAFLRHVFERNGIDNRDFFLFDMNNAIAHQSHRWHEPMRVVSPN